MVTKEVTKEFSDCYVLRVRYRFRNLITGDDIILYGWSKPTTSKERREKLSILREEALDFVYGCGLLSSVEWVLEEIVNEEWHRLLKS